jgi:Sec-independent protein translocase protein TatA
MLGTTEILVVCVVGMFLFGAGKLKTWVKDLKEIKSEWEKPNIAK